MKGTLPRYYSTLRTRLAAIKVKGNGKSVYLSDAKKRGGGFEIQKGKPAFAIWESEEIHLSAANCESSAGKNKTFSKVVSFPIPRRRKGSRQRKFHPPPPPLLYTGFKTGKRSNTKTLSKRTSKVALQRHLLQRILFYFSAHAVANSSGDSPCFVHPPLY